MIGGRVDDLKLTIGNKNYSSWSLRAWIFLRNLGVNFSERVVPLDTPTYQRDIAAFSPTRRVPVLEHGDLRVWDSLAICEYASELTGRGWPEDRAARALARSVSAEMHSGFGALRSQWPMNARAEGRNTPVDAALAADLARIEDLWSDCRRQFGSRGPWLFGEYSVADAMYAPVVLRFRTYGHRLRPASAAYSATVLAEPHLRDWLGAAAAESWTIEYSEIGR
jgi:glutathione S-transferase